MSVLHSSLSVSDRGALVLAYRRLEYPSFAKRLSEVIGSPIESGVRVLPMRWRARMSRLVENAIAKALDASIVNFRRTKSPANNGLRYSALGIASGSLCGLLGTPGLLLELPITTTIIIASIADIARTQGEDLDSIEARMACLEVFALGGRTDLDSELGKGYYGLRLALEIPIARATSFLASHGFSPHRNAPPIINLIRSLAQRFGVVLSDKAMLELIPFVGAAGGAIINTVFIHHFQEVAHSHFTIRRLERKYGRALIQSEYESLRLNNLASPRKRLSDVKRSHSTNATTATLTAA